MKKVISLFLALLMAAALCACGGGNTDNTSGSSDAQTDAGASGADNTADSQGSAADAVGGSVNDAAEDAPETVELIAGTKQSFEKFDITIIGFEYTDSFDSRVEGLWNLGAGDGNVCVNVYYSIKYNEKEAVTTTELLPSHLDFDDGYVYDLSGHFYYNPVNDEWHQSSSRVDGMSPELTYVVGFHAPAAVMNEKEKSLVLEFDIVGEEFTYTPRPASDEAKEATYTYAVDLLESENWDEAKLARAILFELGDYNDSSMTARLRWFTYDDREYFKSDVSALTPVNGEDIMNLFSGKSFVTRSKYSERNMTFLENGTMDAKYTYNDQEYVMYDAWRVEEGEVILSQTNNGTVKEYRMLPYMYNESTYFLICNDGEMCDCSILLTPAE